MCTSIKAVTDKIFVPTFASTSVEDNLSVINFVVMPSWPWIGIQWRADEIYALKFCVAVVDLFLNFGSFWWFAYV